MRDYILNAKKFAIYTLAAIGALMVIWFGWQAVSNIGIPRPVGAPYSGYETGVSVGAPEIFYESDNSLIGRDSGLVNSLSMPKDGGQSPVDAAKGGDLAQKKVVKNGSLEILIKDAEDVASKIKLIAENLSGFVSDSYIFESSPVTAYPFNEKYAERKVAVKQAGLPKSGNITIRVPVSNFDKAMAEIKKLAIRVENENTNAQDVTEQFIDLEARLKNLRVEEAQYQDIMKKAVKIQDILDVVSRLADVRGRIEQIEGQLKYLSRQVDMSTITVTMTAEQEVEALDIRWRPFFVIRQSFKNMLSGFTGYVDKMIGFIFRLPLIIAWFATFALFAFIVWRIFWWVRRKFFLGN